MPAKVFKHVWSYDFFNDMMLSTGKQRSHMIKYSPTCFKQAVKRNPKSVLFRLVLALYRMCVLALEGAS